MKHRLSAMRRVTAHLVTIHLVTLLACACCLSACGGGSSSSTASEKDLRQLLRLPDHLAVPAIPEFNPLTAEKIELGRHLFYDKRLSGNQTQSCASCHLQHLAFSDGRKQAIGSTGERHPRNSQGLGNAMYNASFTWSNNTFVWLEDQIHVPILSDNPIELGVTDGIRPEVLARFGNDPNYQALFSAAFDGSDEVTLSKVIFALASFCRSLVSGTSAYDRFLLGDDTALTESQKRGLTHFNSEKFECFHCHSGVNLSVSYRDNNTRLETATFPFFNNGLYNVGGDGSYPQNNQGLYDLTSNPNDKGLFRPQSLRNVALTAPYMHDGSIPTLRGVIEHYARGGTKTDSGPNAGDGKYSPLKSGLIVGFDPTEQEIEDIVNFLESLTDDQFVTDPRHANPSAPQ